MANSVITQYHYTKWPEHGRPQETTSLLILLGELMKQQNLTGNCPITVMCRCVDQTNSIQKKSIKENNSEQERDY